MPLRDLTHDQAITDIAKTLDDPALRVWLMAALMLAAILFAAHWVVTRPRALRLRVQHRRLMRRVQASRR